MQTIFNVQQLSMNKIHIRLNLPQYLSLITPALANSSKILSSCSLRRSLLSLRFLFWRRNVSHYFIYIQEQS